MTISSSSGVSLKFQPEELKGAKSTGLCCEIARKFRLRIATRCVCVCMCVCVRVDGPNDREPLLRAPPVEIHGSRTVGHREIYNELIRIHLACGVNKVTGERRRVEVSRKHSERSPSIRGSNRAQRRAPIIRRGAGDDGFTFLTLILESI